MKKSKVFFGNGKKHKKCICYFFQPYKLIKMYKAFSKWLKTKTKIFKMAKKRNEFFQMA